MSTALVGGMILYLVGACTGMHHSEGDVTVGDNNTPTNGIWGKILVGLITLLTLAWAWLFTTVNALQIETGKMDARITSLRSDLESQRTAENAFQGTISGRVDLSQSDLRSSIAHLDERLTAAIEKVADENRKSLAQISKDVYDIRTSLGVKEKRQ